MRFRPIGRIHGLAYTTRLCCLHQYSKPSTLDLRIPAGNIVHPVVWATWVATAADHWPKLRDDLAARRRDQLAAYTTYFQEMIE